MLFRRDPPIRTHIAMTFASQNIVFIVIVVALQLWFAVVRPSMTTRNALARVIVVITHGPAPYC